MKSLKTPSSAGFRIAVICLVAVLAACATRPAPNFRGRWKPMNQFAETPVAIPLYEAYVYSAGPMDRTLKGLLTRWAKGSKRTLSYLHSNDYTLYGPVQDINTGNLEQAIAQLNAAYADYGISVFADARQITVRQGAQPAPTVQATPEQ